MILWSTFRHWLPYVEIMFIHPSLWPIISTGISIHCLSVTKWKETFPQLVFSYWLRGQHNLWWLIMMDRWEQSSDSQEYVRTTTTLLMKKYIVIISVKFELSLKLGHTQGEVPGWSPNTTSKLKKKTLFVDTISNILHDLPFSQNQPLKLNYD